jgi:hypothetical protein
MMAWVPAHYSQRVCLNDPTRIFAGFVEYKIDYSKPLQPNNGSWVHANNWAYGLDTTNTQNDGYTRMRWAGTYSNGRTYATVLNSRNGKHEVFELSSSGMRATGAAISGSAQVDSNFNLWYAETNKNAGQVAHLYKNTFTGFDGSNNPTWNTASNSLPKKLQMTTQTLPARFPFVNGGDGNMLWPFALTANGILPVFDYHGNYSPSNVNNHFGGIDFATGKVKFNTMPSTLNTNYRGIIVNGVSAGNTQLLYPDPPFFPTSRTCSISTCRGTRTRRSRRSTGTMNNQTPTACPVSMWTRWLGTPRSSRCSI